jgi:chromosome segregation ATPase
MGDLSEIVDSLENRISKLLHRFEKLKQANTKLEEELSELRSQRQNDQEEFESLHEKYSALKLANSMLGSDQHTRETKLKINALVREIDHCIAQLSE